MTSVKLYMLKLEAIASECNAKEKKPGELEDVDEFTMVKREIVDLLKQVREEVKTRDAINKKSAPNSLEAVRTSAQVRTLMKEIRQKMLQLQTYQRKAAEKINKNKKSTDEQKESIARRDELIENIQKHIEEVTKLERRRYGVDEDDSGLSTVRRGELLGPKGKDGGGGVGGKGGSGGGGGRVPLPSDPTNTALDDIDVDDALLQLKAKDREIDKNLDLISKGLAGVKQQAVQMGNELQVQGQLLTTMEQKIDDTQEHLSESQKRLNAIMKDAAASGDKFMVYFIILVVILACAVFVWNKIQNK